MSETLDQNAIYEIENLLRNPPKGAWVKKDIGREIIGISTRSKSSIFILIFTLAFSGASFLVLFQIIMIRELIVSLLIMLIFAPAVIFLWVQVFYSIFGKIEFVTNKNGQDYIFVGIGRIGKKHVLKWASIKNIFEQISHNSEGGSSKKIFIEGEKLIKISINGINKNKSTFLIKVLKYHKNIKDMFQQF